MLRPLGLKASLASIVAIAINLTCSAVTAAKETDSTAPAVGQADAVVTRDTEVTIPFGKAVVRAGTHVRLISTDSGVATVQYIADKVTIPVANLNIVGGMATPAAARTPASPFAPNLPPTAAAKSPTVPSVGITLARDWDTPMQGGSTAMQELMRLLSPFAKPAPALAADDVEVYPGISYLAPLSVAMQALNVREKLPSKSRVVGAGLPRNSLFYYAIDGSFEGNYSRVYVITDMSDRVASLEFVSESPAKSTLKHDYHQAEWQTYDFITAGAKALKTWWIIHEVAFQDDRDKWITYRPNAPFSAPKGEVRSLKIDTVMLDPDPSHRTRLGDRHFTVNYAANEQRVWYIPRPLAQLILYCAARAGSK